MKSWFAKLTGGTSTNGSTEAMTEIDRSLSAGIVRPEPPPGLEQRILGAVRAAASPRDARGPRLVWRWLPAPALAIAFVLWLVIEHPATAPGPEMSANAGDILEFGTPNKIPEAVMKPLSDEWASLGHDLDQTTEFLLASLP